MKACVVGSLNADLVVRAPRLPAAGETLLGGPFATVPGGKGANQAVALARLGASVAMVGRVGDDDHGARLRAALVAAGVDVGAVALAGVATGVASITVADDGENTIVVAPGANAAVDPAAFGAGAAREAVTGADLVLAQLEVPVPAVAAAFEAARASGRAVRTVLNAAPAAALPIDLLALVDVLVVNEGEARLLAGLAATASFDELGRALCARGPATVAITRGARGARVHDAGGGFDVQAFPVIAVDAVGAGDAFTAAFALALGEGAAAVDAARFACAAGALATTVRGAQDGLPTRAAVTGLL